MIGFRSGLTQSYPLEGYPKGISPNGYGYSVYRNTRGGSLDEIHQFSSTMVLDSRFGLADHPFGLIYPGATGFSLSSLSMSPTGLPYNTFPGVTFLTDNYAGLAPGAGGQISNSALGSLDETLAKQWGRHSFRVGFQGDLLRYNVQNPMSGFGNGSGTPGFVFDRTFTQSNSVLYGAGKSPVCAPAIRFASMLLGAFTTANYNIAIAYATQQIYMAPYFQDDWRVNNKLTVNLGARYDYESPLTERYNRLISGFCTTCANPLQASVTGLSLKGGLQFVSPSSRFPFPHDTHNIAPRLGAAWQVRAEYRGPRRLRHHLLQHHRVAVLHRLQPGHSLHQLHRLDPPELRYQPIPHWRGFAHRQHTGPGDRAWPERQLQRPNPRATARCRVHAEHPAAASVQHCAAGRLCRLPAHAA